LVSRSPPFAVSLSLHVIFLAALALWVVRHERQQRLALDLSFASPSVVDAPVPGVQVAPALDPEPEADSTPTDDSVVEDPAASPPVVPEDPPRAEIGVATVTEPPAPAVGNLLEGRDEGRRAALVEQFGGSDATEAAVARALEWLVKQQDRRDGLWSLQGPYVDGGSQENRLAATAMALLAFQAAGNTTAAGRHQGVVRRAWKALVRRQAADGSFDLEPAMPDHHRLYAHAQATIAACELFGLTNAEEDAEPARRALAYAVAAQGPDGGWRYAPGEPGDMSVTGWYMLALKSAQMAGLTVPPESFAGLASFLESVSVEEGRRYGYRLELAGRSPTQITPAVSAEGLLCRQYLGWRPDDPRLAAGLEILLAAKFIDFDNDKDAYAWYYITQVAHHAGGEPWERWNARMKELLPTTQVRKGREVGSWDPALDKWGSIGGRLYMTCFCTWMLEVYYRHLPLYRTVD